MSTSADNTSSSRIRIRVGAVEIECEASETFIKDELPDIVSAISGLLEGQTHHETDDTQHVANDVDSNFSSSKGIELSPASVCNLLNAKSTRDVFIASVAYQTLVAGKDKITRHDAVTTMREMPAFNKNMVGNLSGAIKTAIKEKSVVEVQKGIYRLHPTKKAQIEESLSE